MLLKKKPQDPVSLLRQPTEILNHLIAAKQLTIDLFTGTAYGAILGGNVGCCHACAVCRGTRRARDAPRQA